MFCFAFILVGCFALGFALVVCSKGSRNLAQYVALFLSFSEHVFTLLYSCLVARKVTLEGM